MKNSNEIVMKNTNNELFLKYTDIAIKDLSVDELISKLDRPDIVSVVMVWSDSISIFVEQIQVGVEIETVRIGTQKIIREYFNDESLVMITDPSPDEL